MTDTEMLNHNQVDNDPAYRDFYAEQMARASFAMATAETEKNSPVTSGQHIFSNNGDEKRVNFAGFNTAWGNDQSQNDDGNDGKNNFDNKNAQIGDSEQVIYQSKDGNRDKIIVIILVVLVAALLIILASFVKKMITSRQVELQTENQNQELVNEITEAELFTPASIMTETETVASPASTMSANVVTASPSSAVANQQTTKNQTTDSTKTQTNKGGQNVGRENGGSVSNGQAATANNSTAANSTTKTNPVNNNSYLNGVVYFSGSMPNDASLLVLQRVAGSGSEYKEITRISASNGSSWSWNGARAGQVYEIVYALQVKGNNVKTSQVATAVAPSRVEIKMYTGQN